MAVRVLTLNRNKLCDFGKLLKDLSKSDATRPLAGLFSTATKQHTPGDDCHGDDGDDDHTITYIRMLELRANKLEKQVCDLTERYRKAVADSDNVRRRTQKFVEDAKVFGIQSFCRDLVEVADLLDRAVEVLEGSEGAETGEQIQGVVQVRGRLQYVFTKHGLEKMNPVGGAYDPYQHEIVCHIPAPGIEPGAVALVKQDGYKLHGRTIRHAHVGVAVTTQER